MQKVQLNKFGTFFDLFIFEEKSDKFCIKILKKEIEEYFIKYENIFSRFIKNSELSKINQTKEGNISVLFFDLFKKIEEINKITEGFFNPFIEIEKIEENKKYLNRIFFGKNISNFEKNFFIRNKKIFLEKNKNLDFGGIGKGYFVDLIAEKLKDRNINNFLINFGGDIYTFGEKEKNKKIRIGIQNPFNKSNNIGFIDLKNGSISSSGRYLKKWEIKGKKYHHILNPFTNSNEIEILMVTIIGNKTYFTDSIATAVFNMGIVKGIEFLNKNNIDGIIIGDNKKAFLTKGFRQKYNFKENK